MKKIIKRFVVISAIFTFLGGHTVFAADQVREQTQDKKQEQECVKDDSGSKTKSTTQDEKTEQDKTTPKSTEQSEK